MKCPRCGSSRTIAGRIAGGNMMVHFRPSISFNWRAFFGRYLYLNRTSATVCLGCGLLWTEFSTDELVNQIRRWGTDEARALIDSDDSEAPRQ